jgi:hypothetical protein
MPFMVKTRNSYKILKGIPSGGPNGDGKTIRISRREFVRNGGE